jgi:hypothetical protein
MKTSLLTFLLIFSVAFAVAQGPVVHLGTAYNIDHITGPRLLSETGTIATQSAKYVHTFGWARQRGWTDAEIMSLSHAEAAWHNAFWSGENGNYSSQAPGHAINIEVPAGKFPVTFPLPFAQGVYKGQGSRFHDNSGTHSYGSTMWYVNHTGWKASKSVDRIILRSANWGVDGGYGAWVHHYRIEGMMFDGNRRTKWMPTAPGESAGIGAWDSGEASTIANCYFDNFEKDGILLVRGTPVNIFACSMFNTSRFGLAIVGGGSVTVTSISGDESGIGLIGSIPGYGRPSNTRLAVFGAKQETSTSGEFRPWKGSNFLYAEGWITATIHGVSYASGWVNPYDFITWVRDPNVGNHSSITVTGTHFFGNAPRCLFYEQDRNAEYLFEGNAWQHAMQSFTWHEVEGLQGLTTAWKTITPVIRTGAKGRLQHVGPDGATSWATAGIYDPTGGVVAPPPQPTPCAYTTGNWSECVNGTQTRTVTASPAGCTGTPPASTQPCTVTPPPPTAGELPLKPSDVVVVVNANDPASRAIADHYKATWGVTREVVLNLGSGQSISTTAFNTERNKLTAVPAAAFALCFTVPTRVNENNSITSAVSHGYTTPTSTAAAPGYGKPSAAVKRAVLVYSIEVINRGKAATGTKPQGTIYTVLANDGGGTAPRGDARAPQVIGAAGDRIRALLPMNVKLVVQDNRKGCPGECPGNELVGKSDVLAYFGSMYKIAQWGTNTILPGAYADNLTSTSGNLPTGQGQTPITAFLPSATSGTVAEPWASSSTNTARQFMRVDTFSVAYFGQGQSFAQAAYRAVERPWRLLIIGDPLCAPYANVTPTEPPPVEPPPVDPPPTGATLGKWSFASGNPASIAGSVGPALVLASGTATISGGNLSTTADHTYWTVNVAGVTQVRLENYVPGGPKPLEFQYIVTNADGKGLIMLPDGSVVDNTAGGDRPVLPAGTLKVGTAWTGTMTLPSPMAVRQFGAAPGQGNAWRGTLAGMEFR